MTASDFAFIAACLVVPVTWGWFVNWLFEKYRRRRGKDAAAEDDDVPYLDYQI